MKRRTDHYASFKDPAAKVFSLQAEDGYLFRQLSTSYLQHYHHFTSSGLAGELVKKNYIIPFTAIETENNEVVLKARRINFVSFPYEWTFNQWKDAALLTLKIQYHALKHGMTLKDATPFNIVFDGCKPLLVDHSSFEMYKEGEPWQAFKQFCENFYMPLLLIQYFDAAGNAIYAGNINGISLDMGLALLPVKAFLNFNTLSFLALPARVRKRWQGRIENRSGGKSTLKKSLQFAEQLFAAINQLKQPPLHTKWNDYYDKNIDAAYLKEKELLVKEWIGIDYKDKSLVDFGCNTGNFSKLLAADVQSIIAFDSDMRSIDELYSFCKQNKVSNINPFTANLSQPTPAIGWNNRERDSLKDRLQGDIGLALALIHHLAIGNHISFDMMADFFAATCKELFIEFIPMEDDKVKLLLNGRQDVFNWYNPDAFMQSFKAAFTLIKQHRFSNNRVLFHFMLKTS